MLDTEMNKIRGEILTAELSNRSEDMAVFETTNIIEELYEMGLHPAAEDLYEKLVAAIGNDNKESVSLILEQARSILKAFEIR